ncbi:DUF1761 domain-containing protein [Hyphococcus flavus]|uniref:DUF1761 domain-containing protein n=1 Tax=Hyphococcus flavus TaxID=1866326 RepID=A0AAF0CF10_9PROT|nr:DUF1761 domain-containing protein [Hyphococcus flavus]WDI30328.1 DUF1761 domain-containing protein [Hyphococcus flavus]
MPKIFGLNLVGVLVASVVFFMVGWIWYGPLFGEAWMAAEGMTEMGAPEPVWLLGGLIITIAQVIGIGLVMRWRNVADMTAAVKTALVLWLVFALPFAHYAYIYTPEHNATMLMIDAGHLLVGWVVSAVVLALIK